MNCGCVKGFDPNARACSEDFVDAKHCDYPRVVRELGEIRHLLKDFDTTPVGELRLKLKAFLGKDPA